MTTRRSFIKSIVGGATLVAASSIITSVPAQALSQNWTLKIQNAHTGEDFEGVYRIGSRYMPEAMKAVDKVLRDFRTGDVHEIDPKLIDALHMMQQKLEVNDPYRIYSAYRSPRTNAMLRKNGHGVARKSKHMEGKAIDFSLPGVNLSHIRKTSIELQVGGVGYYPKSGFVHLDTGRIRQW